MDLGSKSLKDNSDNHRHEKIRIIQAENNRRDEPHAMEMEIKRKVSRVWDLAFEKLQATENVLLNLRMARELNAIIADRIMRWAQMAHQFWTQNLKEDGKVVQTHTGPKSVVRNWL